ncbi:MAG: ATP-binding protein [bacterium]|nr:ATP-binding protein [bacterium]
MNVFMPQISESLAHISLFEGLGNVALEHMAESFEVKCFNKGELMLEAGQPVPWFILIRQGIAGILVSGEVVAYRKSGDFLGEMGTLLDEPASATVRAEEDLEALVISHDRFQEVVPRKTLLKLLKSTGQRRLELGLRLAESLQHTPQGLVKIDSQGCITADISKKCLEYLGAKEVYEVRFKRFDEVMESLSPGFQREWEGFELLFDPKLDESQRRMIQSILPREVTFGQGPRKRTYELCYYSCIDSSGMVTGLDVGLIDITSQKLLETLEREERRKQRIFADPEAYFSVLQLCNAVIEGLQEEPQDLKANLHTLKGIAGLLDFSELSHQCHQLEEELKTGSVQADSLNLFLSFVETARGYLESIPPELRVRLEGVVLSRERFETLRSALGQGLLDVSLKIVEMADSHPFSTLTQRFQVAAENLAAELGKEIEFEQRQTDLMIPRVMLDPLSTLIHLVRNAVDHGIESPDDRLAAGKPPAGKIFIDASSDSQGIYLNFEDDGAGLDATKILGKAIQAGLLEEGQELTEPELYQLIFHPGLSTAGSVTQVSGRGVGMHAVRQALGTIGGQIGITSRLQQGTSFQITLPWHT